MPTYFDVLTAIAFKYFAEQKVDLAVIETGLGGRLDSTNVLKPEITAITSISKDHMAQLGSTEVKIAEEKAGIFKPGVPAIIVQQTPEVEAVFKRVAEQVGTTLDVTGKSIDFSYRFESSRLLGPHNRVCLTTPLSKFEHLAVPLIGEHQAVNCGLALSIIDRLKSRGFNISDAKAMEGLGKTKIAGRMEFVSTTPRVIADGAHNAAKHRCDDARHRPAHPVRLDGGDFRLLQRQRRAGHAGANHQRRRQSDLSRRSTASVPPTRGSWRPNTSSSTGKWPRSPTRCRTRWTLPTAR